MTTSRRDLLALAAAASAAPAVGAAAKPGERAGLPRGVYLNPVLSGDRSDPSVLKDGDDYYATFSSFDYYPGLLLWRSRDLVNWTPIGAALKTPIGAVYAPHLTKHGGRYFIYIPAVVLGEPGKPRDPKQKTLSIHVIHADNIAGPWSEPVDMGIYSGIDPGHVVGEDGRRYLFLNDGQLYPISDDGLAVAGPRQKVYEGWKYPADWAVEGFSLEGPKLIRKDGWFYMFSAQGGTAGPPTSHMIVVARSRSVRGPWENCPHNPIVRTQSADEPWWSRGHGTPVQGPAGDWWLAYHGYRNRRHTLGRQMLLEPMEWTADGWPRARGGDLSKPLRAPLRSAQAVGQGAPVNLSLDPLDSRLQFYKPAADYLRRARSAGGALVLDGQGKGPADASPLAFIAGDPSYEFSVELELADRAQAGLLLFYNERLFVGLERTAGQQRQFVRGQPAFGRPPGAWLGPKVHLKVVNENDVARFFSSPDGRAWTLEGAFEVSGYHHNTAGGFISLRPAIYAAGAGATTFRSIRYRALQAPR